MDGVCGQVGRVPPVGGQEAEGAFLVTSCVLAERGAPQFGLSARPRHPPVSPERPIGLLSLFSPHSLPPPLGLPQLASGSLGLASALGLRAPRGPLELSTSKLHSPLSHLLPLHPVSSVTVT